MRVLRSKTTKEIARKAISGQELVMELKELEERLVPFCQSKYATCDLEVFDVVQMPGHAGFAYGFRVNTGAVGTAVRTDSWFIRLPPPNVNWRGTADVLRQVEVLNVLDGTGIPHCSVQWSGADLEWFDCPYFVVPWLDGDVLRLAEGEWGAALDSAQLLELGRQAMAALAAVHKLDPAAAPYLGEPVLFEEDVIRWDRFFERAADPERLRDVVQMAGITEIIQRLPDGISTRVGERGSRLSGGERKRVALARALARPISVLILDEATSELDPKIEEDIFRSVDNMAHDLIIFNISHRQSVLKHCDRAIFLRNGTAQEMSVVECMTTLDPNNSGLTVGKSISS